MLFALHAAAAGGDVYFAVRLYHDGCDACYCIDRAGAYETAARNIEGDVLVKIVNRIAVGVFDNRVYKDKVIVVAA